MLSPFRYTSSQQRGAPFTQAEYTSNFFFFFFSSLAFLFPLDWIRLFSFTQEEIICVRLTSHQLNKRRKREREREEKINVRVEHFITGIKFSVTFFGCRLILYSNSIPLWLISQYFFLIFFYLILLLLMIDRSEEIVRLIKSMRWEKNWKLESIHSVSKETLSLNTGQ